VTRYVFPSSPYGFWPMRPSPAHHDLHHLKFEGNYGSFFMFWDKLMGTEKDPKDPKTAGSAAWEPGNGD